MKDNNFSFTISKNYMEWKLTGKHQYAIFNATKMNYRQSE